MIKIKNVKLKSNLILAPMAGYTDLAMRKMCSDYGAGLTCTEMISAAGLHYKNKKTEKMLEKFDNESPIAVQIFGHDPEIMIEAVKNPLLSKFDIIDINMGCPAPKIVKNGDGSALMKNIPLAEKIISGCVQATSKPITVKFRLGVDANSINVIEFAKMCEKAGASAITIHGRTAKQGYAGLVDYDMIAKVKESVKIPVFANGDCKNREDFKKILKITKADGVMIGRAAVGHPEIFSEILNEKSGVSADEKLDQIKFHYKTIIERFGEVSAIKYLRSHLAGYLSGEFKNVDLLVKLIKFTKYDEIINLLEKNNEIINK